LPRKSVPRITFRLPFAVVLFWLIVSSPVTTLRPRLSTLELPDSTSWPGPCFHRLDSVASTPMFVVTVKVWLASATSKPPMKEAQLTACEPESVDMPVPRMLTRPPLNVRLTGR
jgi:hypothetical protein